jgi:hypothetical protein
MELIPSSRTVAFARSAAAKKLKQRLIPWRTPVIGPVKHLVVVGCVGYASIQLHYIQEEGETYRCIQQ